MHMQITSNIATMGYPIPSDAVPKPRGTDQK